MKPWITVLAFFVLSQLHAQTQVPPICDAATINLTAFEALPTGLLMSFGITDAAGATAYVLEHRFRLDGALQIETFEVAPPEATINIPFVDTLHQFTIITICEDGTPHIGSSFAIDLTNADGMACPAITNLQIEELSEEFIAFSCTAAADATLFRITYAPDNGATNNFTVATPFVEQILERTTRHTFFITPECTDAPALWNADPGPTVSFTIIIIDDIKVRKLCIEELEEDVSGAYRARCTAHGDFGPNISRFLNFHIDSLMLAPCDATHMVAFQDFINSWALTPNPASNHFTIDFHLTQSAVTSLDILNAQGQVVTTGLAPERLPGGTFRQQVSTADLPPGVYFVRIQVDQYQAAKKLLVIPR